MHIVWLAVICGIDCVWIDCFCVFLFSWVFFWFFLLGPGVTLFSPYKEFPIHRHRTQRSNKDLKYLKEAQLDIIGYPFNCIMGLKSAQNTNGVLNCISIESPSVQNPHSSYDPASRKTSQVQDQRYIFTQRYGSYTKFWLSNAWCLKYVIIRNKVRMWYAQGRQPNHFSHANNQPQNIKGMCMDFSLHISMKFWI